jgi:hypothetical protein
MGIGQRAVVEASPMTSRFGRWRRVLLTGSWALAAPPANLAAGYRSESAGAREDRTRSRLDVPFNDCYESIVESGHGAL